MAHIDNYPDTFTWEAFAEAFEGEHTDPPCDECITEIRDNCNERDLYASCEEYRAYRARESEVDGYYDGE